MKTAIFILFLLIISAPLAGFAAPEMTARDIVKRSDDLMRGDTQEGKYSMTVINPQWERHLNIYVTSKGRDKMFLRILSPAKEKGITTLRVGNEMWNYLPNVERTIKIPPSMMLQPWMGSDFANDDLVKESSVVNDYTHRVVVEQAFNGVDAFCIELTPKPKAGVVWEKRIMWIAKDNFVPLRDEFYGKDNKLIKVLTYSNVKRVSDREIPTYWEMVSEIKKGHRTVIEVDDGLVYNRAVDDSVFNVQNLRK